MSQASELTPTLEVKKLAKTYEISHFLKESQFIKALQSVDFKLFENQTLSVVGESGCGKSTLAKVLVQIEKQTKGDLFFDGKTALSLSEKEIRNKIQMIFQDPYGSLNPRKKAIDLISEPLLINTDMNASERKKTTLEIMERVGLRPEMANRYPHMFSGGQRQRIGIARALVLRPKILICDEPVSALDVSVQAQVLNLLIEIQKEFKLSLLFISHDLSVVKHISDEIMVMYLGKIVEKGNREQIFNDPKHPYTKLLLQSKPRIYQKPSKEGSVEYIKGELPSPLSPPSGCSFRTRCPYAQELCSKKEPTLLNEHSRKVACHFTEID